jgi:hypothetical protein
MLASFGPNSTSRHPRHDTLVRVPARSGVGTHVILPEMNQMTMRRVATALVIGGICLCVPMGAHAQGNLARARRLYNTGNFDAAIRVAAPSRTRPDTASSAALIIARARLERFRRTAGPEDLSAARTELATLNTQNLSRQELIEWQIGLAQTLYFENELGPASEWFRTLIPSVRTQLPAAETEKLIEWWAGATSRLAESLSGTARVDKYRELLTMMELELERDPLSRSATFWISVASRGVGDVDRAWNTAVAGWIRAGGLAGGEQLRADIERLVLQTIIPERAQMRTGQRLDTKTTAAEITALTDEWRNVLRRWNME